jgi:hypothetical protein
VSLLCIFILTHDKALNDTCEATHTYIYLLYSKLFPTPHTAPPPPLRPSPSPPAAARLRDPTSQIRGSATQIWWSSVDTSEEQRSATLLPRSSPARGAGSLQRPRCRLHQSMPSRRRFSTSAAVALLHDAAVRTSARRRNVVGFGASSPACSGQVAQRQRMACAVASPCSSTAGTNYRSLCATGRGGEPPQIQMRIIPGDSLLRS